MKKLTHAVLAALSFVMVLSVGLVTTTERSEAVTYLVQGKDYWFTDSIGALQTFTGTGGVIKVSYYASCTYDVAAGGFWDARLQKQTSNGGWKVVDNTANVSCTKSKKVGTLSFGTVARGTYRLQFKKINRSGRVTIHSFGAYRG
ncbi:hypothetical protein [Kribbella italica]|uniref:Uncharacterized protein n=1 Tax=Kribbella italica TaxID=1540520 RepID=A0A7W9JCX0_9ACTN|nr:hypothetical protein [Kribbella italica]MBB5839487.1 hypothetical protein [Kribbella italica]